MAFGEKVLNFGVLQACETIGGLACRNVQEYRSIEGWGECITVIAATFGCI